MRLILQDICRVVDVRMVKFQFLAHLPVDHLAHSVVFSLILVLCYTLHSFIMGLTV